MGQVRSGLREMRRACKEGNAPSYLYRYTSIEL
jgi:hypothetical protein